MTYMHSAYQIYPCDRCYARGLPNCEGQTPNRTLPPCRNCVGVRVRACCTAEKNPVPPPSLRGPSFSVSSPSFSHSPGSVPGEGSLRSPGASAKRGWCSIYSPYPPATVRWIRIRWMCAEAEERCERAMRWYKAQYAVTSCVGKKRKRDERMEQEEVELEDGCRHKLKLACGETIEVAVTRAMALTSAKGGIKRRLVELLRELVDDANLLVFHHASGGSGGLSGQRDISAITRTLKRSDEFLDIIVDLGLLRMGKTGGVYDPTLPMKPSKSIDAGANKEMGSLVVACSVHLMSIFQRILVSMQGDTKDCRLGKRRKLVAKGANKKGVGELLEEVQGAVSAVCKAVDMYDEGAVKIDVESAGLEGRKIDSIVEAICREVRGQ